MLGFFNKRGLLVSLGAFDDCSRLWLHDKAGQPGVALGLFEDAPALAMWDKAGTDRALLGSTTTLTTKTVAKAELAEFSLVLFDKDGKVIHQVPR